MIKWFIPTLVVAPLFAFAETATYDVSGMTCNSCVKAIKAQVCKMDGVEKCDVSIGKIVLSTKEGVSLDEQKVKEAVSRAGEYKVTKPSTQK